jgi:transposase-like protein
MKNDLIILYNVVVTAQRTGDQVMTIVPIGNLILQEPERNQPGFVPELCRVIHEQIRGMVGRCLEEILESEIDRQLGRKRYVRRRRAKRQESKQYCSRCRTHQRQNFRRNGHYQRYLETQWGRVWMQVPQVKCICGGNVKNAFQTIRRGQRWWEDLKLEVQVEYGRGLSYRQIKADLDERLGSSVGLRTLNQEVLRLVPSGRPFPVFPLGSVPAVIRLDGIWITVMFPTDALRCDRLGRQRRVKRSRKVPILAAQGVWPVTGRTSLLAWRRAEGEDIASWQAFLEQLYEMGLTPEHGLTLLVGDGSPGLQAAYQNRYWMIPLQRCVFHKLKNVAQALSTPTGLDRPAAKAYRTQFLRNAARIWQASDEDEARQRYTVFCQQWRAQQPRAIETLTRDFDETLAFYSVQQRAAERNENWPAHLLRTTSPLERSFREFRRRYRNAVLFHSELGALAVTAQVASRFS